MSWDPTSCPLPPPVESPVHGIGISRSHGMECEQRVPLFVSIFFSSFFFSLDFCMCCQNMPRRGGSMAGKAAGCHMLANAWAHKLPLSVDCICICICSIVSVMARALQNMLLIELNWTCAQFDELRFSCDLCGAGGTAYQMKCSQVPSPECDCQLSSRQCLKSGNGPQLPSWLEQVQFPHSQGSQPIKPVSCHRFTVLVVVAVFS